MTAGSGNPSISEDIVFRLRAKMEDNTYQIVKDGDREVLAFRVGGEEVDLLSSLEYMSEFLHPEIIESVTDLIIISDRNFQATSIDMIVPKLDVKKEDDDRLFNELKTSLKHSLEPLTFTMENDILEMYRIAIRVEGSHNRTDESVGLDLLKVDLPKEGDVIYLIFKDGYRKMSRASFDALVEGSLSSLRQGPSLMKDPPRSSLSRTGTASNTLPRTISEEEPGSKNDNIEGNIKRKNDIMNDPKMVAREISREMADLGYRKDNMFSRNDVNQFFFVSMKGPAIFLKIIENPDELESFMRVLSHRKDALGLLISREWDPKLEAISRINGFIYMEIERSSRAPDVIREVLREGGNS
jgi:hypothetical protein